MYIKVTLFEIKHNHRIIKVFKIFIFPYLLIEFDVIEKIIKKLLFIILL